MARPFGGGHTSAVSRQPSPSGGDEDLTMGLLRLMREAGLQSDVIRTRDLLYPKQIHYQTVLHSVFLVARALSEIRTGPRISPLPKSAAGIISPTIASRFIPCPAHLAFTKHDGPGAPEGACGPPFLAGEKGGQHAGAGKSDGGCNFLRNLHSTAPPPCERPCFRGAMRHPAPPGDRGPPAVSGSRSRTYDFRIMIPLFEPN